MKTTEQQYIELISEVRDTVYRLALNILGSSVEAEDVAQDIYERVWRARDAILARQWPRAYVCRMTRNLAIDRLRSTQRQTLSTCNESLSASDLSTVIDIRDMAILTKRAIGSLPERQRITIYMRDVEGYEIDEIAEAMESDAQSVRMNLSRARKSVRDKVMEIISYGTREN